MLLSASERFGLVVEAPTELSNGFNQPALIRGRQAQQHLCCRWPPT
ncbi:MULTISPECIES: hypothetical protein [Achromobacter]|nr:MULTISPECIES: hypothetical protein [Achromobacter]MDH0682929.1 hypothetical protein [Achromobacter animicus]